MKPIKTDYGRGRREEERGLWRGPTPPLLSEATRRSRKNSLFKGHTARKWETESQVSNPGPGAVLLLWGEAT